MLGLFIVILSGRCTGALINASRNTKEVEMKDTGVWSWDDNSEGS